MKRIKWICSLTVLALLGMSTGCKEKSGPDPNAPFNPVGVLAHYTFENTTDDISGNFDPAPSDVIDITYEDSHAVTAGKAAAFNGSTSLIEISNGEQFLTNGDFSMSFWIKSSGERKGHFVLGLAGKFGFHFEIDTLQWYNLRKKVQFTAAYDGVDSTTREDDIWNGNGKTKDNGGWQGTLVNKDVSGTGIAPYFKDTWVHVVCTYNSAKKIHTMYVNSEKVKQFDFHLWPAGNVRRKVIGVKYGGNPTPGNKLALGFIQARGNRIMTQSWANYTDEFSNHFKGLMDDVWIFSVALSDVEVAQLHNTESKE